VGDIFQRLTCAPPGCPRIGEKPKVFSPSSAPGLLCRRNISPTPPPRLQHQRTREDWDKSQEGSDHPCHVCAGSANGRSPQSEQTRRWESITLRALVSGGTAKGGRWRPMLSAASESERGAVFASLRRHKDLAPSEGKRPWAFSRSEGTPEGRRSAAEGKQKPPPRSAYGVAYFG